MQQIMLGYEKPLAIEEVRRVTEAIANIGAKVVSILLAETGLRPIEIFNLRMNQVDLEK